MFKFLKDILFDETEFDKRQKRSESYFNSLKNWERNSKDYPIHFGVKYYSEVHDVFGAYKIYLEGTLVATVTSEFKYSKSRDFYYVEFSEIGSEFENEIYKFLDYLVSQEQKYDLLAREKLRDIFNKGKSNDTTRNS